MKVEVAVLGSRPANKPTVSQCGRKATLGQHKVSEHARKYEARPPRIKLESRLDSNNFAFVCAGASNADG